MIVPILFSRLVAYRISFHPSKAPLESSGVTGIVLYCVTFIIVGSVFQSAATKYPPASGADSVFGHPLSYSRASISLPRER